MTKTIIEILNLVRMVALESGEARNPYATYDIVLIKELYNPSELSRLEAAGIGLNPGSTKFAGHAAADSGSDLK